MSAAEPRCIDCERYPVLEGEALCPACIETAAACGLTAAQRVGTLRAGGRARWEPAPPAPRRFYIARNPDVSAAQVALARARSYSRLEDAVADMESGVVFDDAGEIVAFHERHLRWLEYRAAGRTPRMSNAPAVAS